MRSVIESNSTQRKWVTPHTELKWRHGLRKGFASVIIPAYKDFKGLETTLKSLQSQDIDASAVEVIVANDGAMPEITDTARRYGALVVEISPNMGSYYARNRALEMSRGEFFAFIDADMRVPSGWLASGIEGLKDADYVAGGVKIDTNIVRTIAQLHDLLNAFPVKWYMEELHFGVTASLFVRRGVFMQIGGFDQRLRSGGDSEFGDRVFLSGFKQVFMEKPAAVHPPRDYAELKSKRKRIAKGREDCALLYPDRLGHLSAITPGFFLTVLLSVIPPPRNIIDEEFPERRGFSTIRLYLFLWKYRIVKVWITFLCAFLPGGYKSDTRQDKGIAVKVVRPSDPPVGEA